MGTTETLARWVVDTSYEQLPSGAIAQAKNLFLITWEPQFTVHLPN